jgi:hypothetical protein
MNVKNKINLLRQIKNTSSFDGLVVDTGAEEWQMLVDWTVSGLIDSACHTDGDKSTFSMLRFNEGAASLLRELESETSVGIIKQNRFGIYKWFLTAIGTAAIGYFVWLMQQ